MLHSLCYIAKLRKPAALLKNRSKLMFGLAQAGVALNRKVLADLAVRQKEDFAKLVELAKTKLA